MNREDYDHRANQVISLEEIDLIVTGSKEHWETQGFDNKEVTTLDKPNRLAIQSKVNFVLFLFQLFFHSIDQGYFHFVCP